VAPVSPRRSAAGQTLAVRIVCDQGNRGRAQRWQILRECGDRHAAQQDGLWKSAGEVLSPIKLYATGKRWMERRPKALYKFADTSK
jgi:hypothetical protein